MKPAPKTAAEAKSQALCEFSADGMENCEACGRLMDPGEPVFWFSDGNHFESRDGSYYCEACADFEVSNDTRFQKAG